MHAGARLDEIVLPARGAIRATSRESPSSKNTARKFPGSWPKWIRSISPFDGEFERLVGDSRGFSSEAGVLLLGQVVE